MKPKKIAIKVCGITQTANMLEVAKLQPDYMGFIFYAPSARDVSTMETPPDWQRLPPSIRKVAVLVNMPLDNVFKTLNKDLFPVLQLHGEEDPIYCRELAKEFSLIKAFRVGDQLPDAMEAYQDYCDFFLFDTLGPLPGGNGQSFNHSLLEQYRLQTPFFLSGGIAPEHLKAIQAISHPAFNGIDLNSRFEIKPGIKDPLQLKPFIQAIQEH